MGSYVSFLQRHILGFAVGHHTNDANHQQRHTDACDRQHPPLVELLSLCGWKHTHIQTHTCSHARIRSWIIDTCKTDRKKYTHTRARAHAHTQTHTHTAWALLHCWQLQKQFSHYYLLPSYPLCYLCNSCSIMSRLSDVTVPQSYNVTTTQEWFYKLINIMMKSRDVNLHPDIDFLLSLWECIYNGRGDVTLWMALAGIWMHHASMDGKKHKSPRWKRKREKNCLFKQWVCVNTTVAWE